MIYVIIIAKRKKNMTMTLKFQDKVLLTSICQKTKQRYSSICRRYRCISILLINDCVPFNLSSIKSSTRFILSLMATLGFTTLVIQHGFMGSLFGIENTGPLLAFLPVITIGLLFDLPSTTSSS